MTQRSATDELTSTSRWNDAIRGLPGVAAEYGSWATLFFVQTSLIAQSSVFLLALLWGLEGLCTHHLKKKYLHQKPNGVFDTMPGHCGDHPFLSCALVRYALQSPQLNLLNEISFGRWHSNIHILAVPDDERLLLFWERSQYKLLLLPRRKVETHWSIWRKAALHSESLRPQLHLLLLRDQIDQRSPQ